MGLEHHTQRQIVASQIPWKKVHWDIWHCWVCCDSFFQNHSNYYRTLSKDDCEDQTPNISGIGSATHYYTHTLLQHFLVTHKKIVTVYFYF